MPRWYKGLVVVLIYLEIVIIVSLKIHLPEKPDPVFQKPAPTNEYHWTKGPYDDDWDYCWSDWRTGAKLCYAEQT